MALTQQEIDALTNTHKTDISALNAIVQLINGGASSSDISALLTAFNSNTEQERTPNLIRVSNAGNLGVQSYHVSVANVGTTNGTALGTTIAPGETVPFPPGGLNNYFGTTAFTYDGTGTVLLISYIS